MKKIKLQRMALENFKCHRSLTLDFRGGSASVYGDNATGKTSVYDALTWLLFGRDSLGNGEKNMEIKPLNAAGEVADHQAVTAVEAVLSVDGETVTLRRTYQEIWSTRRGNPEPVYGGNTSEYFVDGVPCKKFAFEQRVEEIIDQDTWLMLTSVSCFARDLPWQKRREILLSICGAPDDRDILATREDFAPLLEAIGKHTLEELKAKLNAQKRGFVGARNEIPARLNECQKTVDDLVGFDFEEARAQVDSLTARRFQIDGKLSAIDHSTAADGKTVELGQAQLELQKLEAENKTFRDGQIQPKPDTRSLRREVDYASSRLKAAKDDLARQEKCVLRYDRDIKDARDKWMGVSAETFHGSGTCPTCGQPMPAGQIQAAKDAFERQKAARLLRIEQDADEAKNQKFQAEAAAQQSREDISKAQAQIASLEENIQYMEDQWVQPEIRDMPDYRQRHDEIAAWIAAIQDALHQLRQDANAAGEGLRQELVRVNAQIASQLAILSKKDVLSYAQKRMENLRAEAADGAAKLAEIEKLLYLMEEFLRYKTSFLEDSVNAAFRIARFRLFREQANGGLEDRCDVVCDGIPYGCLNSGARINVGIDIINTLSRAYGVEVPLFIDNAESVTQLENSVSQAVRLVVSEYDKELRIDYEN